MDELKICAGRIVSLYRTLIGALLITVLCSPRSGMSAPQPPPDMGRGQEHLLLHARMESEKEINSPFFVSEKVVGWEQGKGARKSPGAEIRFESRETGSAARFVTNDKGTTSAVAIFAPGNFDFSDALNRGGKLEFWLKFNEDPHQFNGNRMILRTEPYLPALTIEIYGSRPFLALEFHGNGNNPKTNYRFITYSEGWGKWYD